MHANTVCSFCEVQIVNNVVRGTINGECLNLIHANAILNADLYHREGNVDDCIPRKGKILCHGSEEGRRGKEHNTKAAQIISRWKAMSSIPAMAQNYLHWREPDTIQFLEYHHQLSVSAQTMASLHHHESKPDSDDGDTDTEESAWEDVIMNDPSVNDSEAESMSSFEEMIETADNKTPPGKKVFM